jgi:peptidoglycan/LPS O-acetylase OafA/YrhL
MKASIHTAKVTTITSPNFFQRPIIRMVYNGQAAITIFFVLSGYVLSYRPYKLIHAREFEKLQGALISTIFRRWSRLFLPVAALWDINVFLVEFNAFQWFAIYRIDNPNMPPGMIEEYPEREDSFWGTAHNAYKDFFESARSTLWNWSGIGMLPKVHGHTWTLHVEFRSSCVLFLFLHGTSKMQPNLRLAFFMLSSATALFWDEWAIGTFLAGSAIADIDLRMRRRRAHSTPSPNELSSDQYLGLLRATKPSMSMADLRDWAMSFIESQGDQLF